MLILKIMWVCCWYKILHQGWGGGKCQRNVNGILIIHQDWLTFCLLKIVDAA